MSYNENHLTRLQHLKELAERAQKTYAKQSDLEALQSRVDGIASEGGEPNVIDTIKVNGKEQEATDKTVDITVPEKVSDLENDEDFQTETEVQSAIETAISETGHASFQVVDAVPAADEAEENVLYLVKNEETGYYDIYALISGEVVRLDDTSVDLTDYVTEETLDAAIEDFITLSDIDYEDAGSGNVVTALTYDQETGIFTVTKDATALLEDDIATDEEVTEMLDEIYGTD